MVIKLQRRCTLRKFPARFFFTCRTTCLLVLSLLALNTVPVRAQPVTDATERLIQLEQQRQAEERRRIENRQRSAPRQPVPDTTDELPSPAEGTCFEVNRIELKGVTLYPLSSFDPIIASRLDQCLGVNQLNTLLKDITRVYFDDGHVTSRAYLPQQNLRSGALIVQVVEGTVEVIERDPKRTPWWDTAFPGLEENALNLRDLEQGLDQINRLQSYNATMNLLPGSHSGASRVQISERTERPWHVKLMHSNSGQSSTGELQQQFMLGWDNPSGLYDYVYLSVQADTKDTGRDGARSESISGHWDIPLGYWSMSIDLSHFVYLSTVAGVARTFESSGTSESQRLSLQRLINRDADSKTFLKVTLARKKNSNFIEDTLIETSSRTLGVSELALKHEQHFANNRLLVSELAYHRGLSLFGAPDDDAIDGNGADSPKAQFEKVTFSADYQHPFPIANQRFRYNGRINSQYSPDVLFGSESFSIGSAYSVRGYKESSLSSHSGAFWRNDLHIQLAPIMGVNISPFIGLDAGLVRDESQHTDKYEKLKGCALGLTARARHWRLEMTWSKPIDAPDYLESVGEEFDFSISANF
jgi:hemolysin activation/secretion protein